MSARTDLLARPNKYKLTQKFQGLPQHVFKPIERPNVPIKNERIDLLAEPNKFRKTPKYEVPRRPSTTIPRDVLESTLTPRLDHLSRPFVIKLLATRAQNKFLGKAYHDKMTEKIATSLDTIYYFNKKEKILESMKAKKRHKQIWNCEENRLSVLANPKRIHEAQPLPKRKKKSLAYLNRRLTMLAPANARKIYKRPSQDSFLKLERKRFRAARKYQTSERIIELCGLPQRRLMVASETFFGVKRGALVAEMTERLEELAAPKARANAPENDLKDNAWEINPYALKYKATARIIKLAKPIVRP